MEEQRMQVLEMVAAGRITPEQGSELLEALGMERQPQPPPHVTHGPRLDP